MRHRLLLHPVCTGVPTLLFLALPTLSAARASDREAETITWRSDYARALEEARTRNQLLWIQFTGPWCPNCKRMEDETFPHPVVREHAQRSFVPVKIRSDLNQELALSFELSGLPATVVVAPSRKVLAVRQGYLGPQELGEVLRESLARHSRGSESTCKPAVASDPRLEPVSKFAQDPNGKKETELALSGYCPVSLVSDKRLVQGQAEYTVAHEGRLYRFASMITFNLFRRDPDRFVPVNNGNCPVARIDRKAEETGDPRFGVLYQGRLFLCSSDTDRRRFLGDPARYAVVDVAEQGCCPHCLSESGTLVRGDPRFDLNQGGRRYWFPDASHRDAFLAAAGSAMARH
jgi:YHS domain-containing protein